MATPDTRNPDRAPLDEDLQESEALLGSRHKPRHLVPDAYREDATDYNPYAADGDDFSPVRRGVGDDVADPGRVEPYGHLEERENFHLDEHIWVCGSCGYQTGGIEDSDGACPNCATQGEFIIMHQ